MTFKNAMTILAGAVACWALTGAVVVGVLSINGCAPVTVASVPAEQRVVYQAESDFAAALTVAVAYEKSSAADPAVVAKLQLGAKTAKAGLDTAEGLARAGSSAAQVDVALSAVRDFVVLAGSVK